MFCGHCMSNGVTPAALAAKRPLPEDYVKHVQSFLPVMQFPLYKLDRAALWFQQWIDGLLPTEKLLDISALLMVCLTMIFLFENCTGTRVLIFCGTMESQLPNGQFFQLQGDDHNWPSACAHSRHWSPCSRFCRGTQSFVVPCLVYSLHFFVHTK